MKNFRKLHVWERAHLLTLWIYKVTKAFPKEERYGLISQMRRAGASIPTNIAEGCVRTKGTEFGRFLEIALGSASELEYLLVLVRDLHMITSSDYEALSNEVIEIKRMLTSFIKTLKAEC
jgi:four helix bundle protein